MVKYVHGREYMNWKDYGQYIQTEYNLVNVQLILLYSLVRMYIVAPKLGMHAYAL